MHLPVYPSRHIAIADSLVFDAPSIAPLPRLSASYMIQMQKSGSVELHDSTSGTEQTPNPASNNAARTRADPYLSKDCFAGCASLDSNAENVDPSCLDFLSSFSTCSRNSYCSSTFFSSPVTCQKLHVRFRSSKLTGCLTTKDSKFPEKTNGSLDPQGRKLSSSIAAPWPSSPPPCCQHWSGTPLQTAFHGQNTVRS